MWKRARKPKLYPPKKDDLHAAWASLDPKGTGKARPARGAARRACGGVTREFRDVVFEDVGFENNSRLTLNN